MATKDTWDSYLATARERYEEIVRVERYKIELGGALTRTREALLRNEQGWPRLVKEAIGHKLNNIVNWRNHSKLNEWIDRNVDEARGALLELWTEDDRSPGARVRSFDAKLPESVFSPGATGTRLNVASYFMMGIDPQRYPPYRRGRFQDTYRRLGHPPYSAGDVGGEYEYALGFLDRVLEEAHRRDMAGPGTRLDAQSVVWMLQENPETPPLPPQAIGPVPSSHALNTILYGPPGTGKTWYTVTHAVAIVENREVDKVEQEGRADVKRRFDEYRGAGQVEMVTFHQNTTYEDFVEGIRPVLADGANAGAESPAESGSGGEIRYELSRGVFRRIAERAAAQPDRRYVLVIDEINRGNIARIFGELITLIEDSKRIGQDDEARVTLPGSKTDFGVPANLHVLGTMNTADRSIALLDTALRRRFVFQEMMPNPYHPGLDADVDGVDRRRLLAAMNRRIARLLDREHQIGHTYFLGADTLESLASRFQTRIMPLLQEYFYDDWEKIRAVLNDNGFVRKSEPPEELAGSDLVDESRALYDLPPADDGRWTALAEYRAIYETTAHDGSVARGPDQDDPEHIQRSG